MSLAGLRSAILAAPRPARHGRTRLLASILTTAGLLLGTAPHGSAQAPPPTPRPIALNVNAANGVGLVDRPGRSCAEGGNGAHFHYAYAAPLGAGVFGAVPADARLHLDLHSEAKGAPQPTYSNAFLLGRESNVALSNERGTVKLALQSGKGTCDDPNVAFDGTRVTSPVTGTWSVAAATGSYRQAKAGPGANVFELAKAEVAPGADNPFQLKLSGSLEVLQPQLQVRVKQAYWGFLGADYLLRRVTVVYEVKNFGTGDAYGVRINDVTSPTSGVKVLGPKVQKLGDLAAGESEEARVKFDLSLVEPCKLVVLNCAFESTLKVSMPDALDGPNDFTRTAQAKAPELPPPLL